MWPTLTGLLGRRTSHLAKYMARSFSNTLEVRREFRDACGPMLVDDGNPKDGTTAGAAFDLLVAARMRPTETLVSRPVGLLWTEKHAKVVDELNDRVLDREGLDDDSDSFFAAMWALGLFVNSIRSLEAFTRSPTAAAVREAAGDAQAVRDVLALVPASGITDLRRLDALARQSLYPRLHEPATFHPWLEFSSVQAEADVIADGKLIDLKTTREPTSGKGLLVPPSQIYQIIAYAVINNIEYRKAHGTVHSVGIYAARFGTLHTWPLAELLDRVASTGLKPYSTALDGIMDAIESDGLDAQFG